MTKRILITGGAGFLGTHLCLKLLNDGHHVIAMDNMHTGQVINITSLQVHKNFEFINQSILDPITIDPVDEIYNLACPASPPAYQADPIYTWKVSVLGAMNILDLANQFQAKVFQASTSEVYGDPAVHPQPESYWGHVNPIGIRSCYDEGKRAAETLFMDYHRTHGTHIKIVRIFNTYGPHMNPTDGRVVSNFICQALRGDPITIYGDGQQTRSFCYVDDLIDGFIRLMNSNDTITGPINIGNPDEYTMMELAHLILNKTNSSSELIHKPLPGDDPQQRRPDITRAQNDLNWRPTVDLGIGIDRTIPWFMSQLKQSA